MLLKFYKEQWQFLKDHLLKYFLFSLFIFIAINTLVYFLVIVSPESIADIKRGVIDSFGGEEKIKEAIGTKTNSLFYIFKNNMTLSFILLFVGLIPFYIGSLLVFFPNTIMLGVVFGISKIETGSAFTDVWTMLAPHGITELLSIFLTVSLSLFLSHLITKKITSRKRDTILLKKPLLDSIKVFLFLAVPLMLLSITIEAFLTPVLIEMF